MKRISVAFEYQGQIKRCSRSREWHGRNFSDENCPAEECDDLLSGTMKQLNNYSWGVREAGNNIVAVALWAAMLSNKLSDAAQLLILMKH